VGPARRLAAVALLGLAALPARAQDASVRAEVDARRVGVDDTLQLSLTLEGPGLDLAEEVRVPPLQNLQVVGGPSVSTQVSIVNGSMTQARVYAWALQARAKGTAEVGAFHVKLKSGEKATAPIAIEVVAGSAQPPRRRSDPLNPFGGEDPFERLFGRQRRGSAPPPKLYVEAAVDRTKLYVGEPLVLTYYVVTQTTVTDLAFADPPQFPGFWSEDLPRPEQGPGGEPVTREGESYRRFAFLQKLLFPTKAGALEIPPVRLRLSVARGTDFFMHPASAVVERRTEAIPLTAEPLPAEGFGGAVGSFRVSATLDRSSVPLGEAATLRFRVEGRGNLKWIDQPPDVAVAGAKVYPPQARSELKVTSAGMSGSRTWEFVIVPETGGQLEVPALPFSYFDPSSRRVVNAGSEPLALQVEGSVSAGAAAPASTVAAAIPGALSLRSDIDARHVTVPYLAPLTLALGLAAAVLGHALLWGSAAWRDRRLLASGRSTSRRSVRASLAQLERVARGGYTKEAAAALVEKTLHEVFGPLENGSGPAQGEREKELRQVLEAVRFVRYAPQLGDYSEKVRELAGRAAEVVRRWA
jgi:hypothetical protein